MSRVRSAAALVGRVGRLQRPQKGMLVVTVMLHKATESTTGGLRCKANNNDIAIQQQV